MSRRCPKQFLLGVPDVFVLSVSNPRESCPLLLLLLLRVGKTKGAVYVWLRRGRRASFSKRPIDPSLMAFDPSPLTKADADRSPADLLIVRRFSPSVQ